VQHLTRDDAREPVDLHLLDELPPFDPRTSRARREYGVLPEFLRTTPGAARA
jgi:aminoglycoside 3-N-acetyltransferase